MTDSSAITIPNLWNQPQFSCISASLPERFKRPLSQFLVLRFHLHHMPHQSSNWNQLALCHTIMLCFVEICIFELIPVEILRDGWQARDISLTGFILDTVGKLPALNSFTWQHLLAGFRPAVKLFFNNNHKFPIKYYHFCTCHTTSDLFLNPHLL